jgi:hypothetical protein
MATMEEEENLPILDELASNSLEKQALGLQHIVLLAEANKDVAVYFGQICQVRAPPPPHKCGIDYHCPMSSYFHSCYNNTFELWAVRNERLRERLTCFGI